MQNKLIEWVRAIAIILLCYVAFALTNRLHLVVFMFLPAFTLYSIYAIELYTYGQELISRKFLYLLLFALVSGAGIYYLTTIKNLPLVISVFYTTSVSLSLILFPLSNDEDL
jgi:hypothetical protein